MSDQPHYPYADGDIVVLGPQVFASADGETISWQGANYQRDRGPEHGTNTRDVDAELRAANEEIERLTAELDEARQWARHGYEIGQRHCGWTDHGVAPAWLTEGWPRAFDSCEHLKQMAEFDEALTRVRALAERWRYTSDRKHGPLTELRAALQPPAHDAGPTVAEAKADDQRWWNDKYAGEGQ